MQQHRVLNLFWQLWKTGPSEANVRIYCSLAASHKHVKKKKNRNETPRKYVHLHDCLQIQQHLGQKGSVIGTTLWYKASFQHDNIQTVWPINTGARKAFAVRKVFKCSIPNVRGVYLLTVLPHAQHDSLYSTSHKGTAVLEKLTSIQNTLQCLPSTSHQSVSHWHTTHSFAPFRQ